MLTKYFIVLLFLLFLTVSGTNYTCFIVAKSKLQTVYSQPQRAYSSSFQCGSLGCPDKQQILSRAQGNKTFFMLNSTENEICSAHKKINTNDLNFYLQNTAEHEIFPTNKYSNANCWYSNIFSRKNFMLN